MSVYGHFNKDRTTFTTQRMGTDGKISEVTFQVDHVILDEPGHLELAVEGNGIAVIGSLGVDSEEYS